MKIFILFFILFNFVYADTYAVYNLRTMIDSTAKALKGNSDPIWEFKNNHRLLDIMNTDLRNELAKYYSHMESMGTPITFTFTPSVSMCKTIVKRQTVLSIFDKNYTPKRNDLLVFYVPQNLNLLPAPSLENGKFIYKKPAYKKTKFLKRCVAVGGDEIFVRNKNLYLHLGEGDRYIKKIFSEFELISYKHKLWIKNPYMEKNDGIFHDINATKENIPNYSKIFDLNITKIKNGTYFMMGDNREHSSDSRLFGSIQKKDILGKVILLRFKSDLKNIFGIQSNIDSLCEPPKIETPTYRFMDLNKTSNQSIKN